MRLEKSSEPTQMQVYSALEEFSLSLEDEIESMTRVQVQEAIAANAVSMEPLQEGLLERLEAARNRLALIVAGEERLSAQNAQGKENAGGSVSLPRRAAQASISTGRALREEVGRRLSALGPQSAMMYARNFEEGDDDDLRVILQALDQLDEAPEE